MPKITTTVTADEKSYQEEFYSKLYGDNDKWREYVCVDRSTDGYTDGILFEHKTNVKSYGEAKALGQAIIYLARFNRDGVPVPRYVCLVSQDEKKVYVHDMSNYISYINDIEKYANLQASKGIHGFQAGQRLMMIDYDLGSYAGMKDIALFVEKPPETLKVTITPHNVYGWSTYYYDHARDFRQKPEKKAFFNELRSPTGTLAGCIEPWTGKETDFRFIMDMLNDPMTQKRLGCFYTPPQYAKLSAGLVKKAAERIIRAGKKDYVIIDRCGGCGSLEMFLDDDGADMLSHVIVSTYELKEWMVLKDRFGSRVRYIIPPIPDEGLPDLNDEGFLRGANALTRDILDNENVMKYVNDNDCGIILLENPPLSETTNIEFQKRNEGKKASSWKQGFVVEEMKKHVSGAVSNEMGNAFIWSAFEYFLRQPTDSYIVFSPVKYWKAQHLVRKKFMGGYAFNRKHFHAPTDACVMCAWWSNEDDLYAQEIELDAYDINGEHKAEYQGKIKVKQIHSIFSEKYYDLRTFCEDATDGIACNLDGTVVNDESKKVRIQKIYNTNILGYLAVDASGFDSPRLHSCLTIGAKFNGNGFFLRSDNFLEKLPLFAASRYTDNCNDWKIMSMVMKSGDRAEQYEADVRDHKLDAFLCKCLIWTSLTHYAHMRSLYGSDGRFYRNELCLDEGTLASRTLDEFITSGYRLSAQEEELISKYKDLLRMVRTPDEDGTPKENYKEEYAYGLYQIDEEINLKDEIKDGSGKTKYQYRYGDMNNLIKDIKALLKNYYMENIADTLFEYEFLK